MTGLRRQAASTQWAALRVALQELCAQLEALETQIRRFEDPDAAKERLRRLMDGLAAEAVRTAKGRLPVKSRAEGSS